MDDLLKKQNKTSRWLRLTGLCFVLPAILFQLFFNWLPVLCAFGVSFQEFNYVKPAKWVGFENFRRVIEHPESTPLPNWRPGDQAGITVAVVLICMAVGVFVGMAWSWVASKQRMTRGEFLKGLILRILCLAVMPMLGLTMQSDVPDEASYWLHFSLQWAMTLGAILFALCAVTSVYGRVVRKRSMATLMIGLAVVGFFIVLLRPLLLLAPRAADNLLLRPLVAIGQFSNVVMEHRPLWLTAFALCTAIWTIDADRERGKIARPPYALLPRLVAMLGAALACLAPVAAAEGVPGFAGVQLPWILGGLMLMAASAPLACVGSRIEWQSVVGGTMNASCALIGPVLLAIGLCTGLGVAWRNTFLFAAMSLGLTFVVPIIVSVLLMEMSRRVVRWMMLLWFLPAAGMAGIMIWLYFYQRDGGLLNTLLMQVKPGLEFFGFVGAGWEGFGWLNDKQMAMFCLVLPGLVMFGPGLVYIASLHALPEELYEAAEMEGAGFWQKIFHVTLPRLRPIISMMLVLSTIGALQVFGEPFIMTRGGPGNATVTVALQVYRLAIEQFRLGEGTALSVILFFVVLVLIVFQRTYFKEDPDK
jgi:multiple sugar transport system permease protein